jgi:hypothetical protein
MEKSVDYIKKLAKKLLPVQLSKKETHFYLYTGSRTIPVALAISLTSSSSSDVFMA